MFLFFVLYLNYFIYLLLELFYLKKKKNEIFNESEVIEFLR